ncbi:DNA methyltransferase, partial [Paracoccus pantotrophus]
RDRPRGPNMKGEGEVTPQSDFLKIMPMHGKTTGVVLDPFAGSGTMLVAAQRLGWDGIGIEIDEVHAETARMRIAKAQGAGEP